MEVLLGKRLRELREGNQLLQKDLAKIINVDPSIITKWELGRARPVYEDLISLAQYFEVSVDYLLGLEN